MDFCRLESSHYLPNIDPYLCRHMMSLSHNELTSTFSFLRAPNRRQVIIWTNADPIHQRVYAALGTDELKYAPTIDATFENHTPVHDKFE